MHPIFVPGSQASAGRICAGAFINILGWLGAGLRACVEFGFGFGASGSGLGGGVGVSVCVAAARWLQAGGGGWSWVNNPTNPQTQIQTQCMPANHQPASPGYFKTLPRKSCLHLIEIPGQILGAQLLIAKNATEDLEKI